MDDIDGANPDSLKKCPPLKTIFKIKTIMAKRETKNPAFLNLSHINY